MSDFFKYIPAPRPNQLKKLNAGERIPGVEMITLMAPDPTVVGISYLNTTISSNNKDVLVRKYQPFISMLRKGMIIVKLTGKESDVLKWGPCITKFIEERTPLKADFVNLALIFEWIASNTLALLKLTVNELELQTIVKIVEQGGMELHDIMNTLGINQKSFHSWDYTRYAFDRMTSHPSLRIIRDLSDSLPCRYESHTYDDSQWILPNAKMISLALNSRSINRYWLKRLDKENIPEGSETFSISVSAAKASVLTLYGMMRAGVLVNGRSRINATVLRKVTDALILPDLPVIASDYDNTDTTSILAHLMLLGDIDTDNFTIQKAFRAMTECLGKADPQLYNFFISRSLTPVTPSLRDILSTEAKYAAIALEDVARILTIYDDNEWCDMESFRDSMILCMASLGRDFSFSRSTEWNGKIKLEDGSVMRPSEIKSRFYDVFLDSFILAFAAMGGVELLMFRKKAIGIRITRLGKWLLNPRSIFPLTEDNPAKRSDFEVDDELLFIRIKNPASPFISILNEWADPVMSNRYRISDAKLLKGCKSKEDLNQRITQLKEFVIGTPGPRMEEHLKELGKRYNSITPHPDGDCYRLFDLNSAGRNLLRIIMEDEEIMRGTLRVEGCRLLINEKFLPKFIEKMRNAGYPVVI